MDRQTTSIVLAAALITLAGCSGTHRNVVNVVHMTPEAPSLAVPAYRAKAVQVATEFARAEATGGAVALADGSRWEVREADRREALIWRPASRVIVVESNDDAWPYTLINLDTHNAETLRVRREG